MKHIINFYAHTTSEGNELKWVGNTKKGSQYEIRRSTNELDFEVIKTIDGKGEVAQSYELTDSMTAPEIFYQVAYFEGAEEVEVSQVESIITEKIFNYVNLIIRVAVAIALIALAVTMFKKIAKKEDKNIMAVSAPTLKAAKMKTVEYKNFNTSVEALGQIISTQPIDIVAEVSGKIVKGDVVLRKARNFNKGALLFRVDNGEVILNLKSQRSNFLNALVLMLSDLKLDFPDEFDKWNNYFLGIDISRSIPSLPTINSDREKTFVATKNILGQFYSIKSAEERLSKYEVYAPYSGTITDVYTDAGSVANPGTRIVKVMRTDQLELELPVRKEDIQWIKIGTNVQLFSEDKRQSANGKVVRMSNTLDPNTQSINVYISVNPRGMKLYEGMYLVAKLAGRSINNAMEIDRKAVFDNNKVYVMTADSLLEQRIITVHKVNTETILCSGLDKGAKVVNDNLLGLSESVKVVPLK
jgi:membrane fusion protein (multidrug efflux system)